MTLNELLEDQQIDISNGDIGLHSEITGLALDSRKVVEGHVFIALSGSKQHGLEHACQALANGAIAVIFEPKDHAAHLAGLLAKTNQGYRSPIIAVEGLSARLGEIAAKYYGLPSKKLDVIGITGTNGKTSCSQFLAQLLDDCGIIGTLGWGQWGALNSTLNTTPDALEVQRILAEFVKQGQRTVAMEVSSHGLEQGRVNNVHFKGAVFTNISRDHLDYHETMDAYFKAKLKLLDAPGLAFAVVNLDDDYSEQIIAATAENVALWGFSAKAEKQGRRSINTIVATKIQHRINGMQFDVVWANESRTITVPLYGDFNIENVLAVLTVMLALGFTLNEVITKLANIKPIVGRMERLGEAEDPLIFVDYAHTPDALEKVLTSARQHTQGKLWVVFGCGGNRDKGKRPLMGASAELLADYVVVTDDNPRYENGQDIVNDILAGRHSAKIEVIRNREQAIYKVIKSADKHDCIVIAGKGHENYQELNGERTPFSDSQVALEALSLRAEKLAVGDYSCS